MALNSNDTFVALIDQNGMIRDMSTGRRGEIIGVDYQKEDEYKRTIAEMQEVLDSWRPKMIEAGYIVEPKTPEQIAQEAAAEQLRLAQEQAEQQAAINQALLEAISGLKSELGELRNGTSGNGNEPCDKPIGQDSASNRKATGGSKGRNKPSAEDVT